MLQLIEWNDDEGNQTLAISEDSDKLEAKAAEHNGSPLEWDNDPHNPDTLITPHEYGRMYSIESIEVL